MGFTVRKMLGRFAAMGLVTLFAVAVMLASGTKWIRFGPRVPVETKRPPERPAAVAVRQLVQQPVELIDAYSGMIRPFERHTVSFEIAGRLQALGSNEKGEMLDEGDRVSQGQLLAQLDQRALEARLKETTARLLQASRNLQRIEELVQSSSGSISQAEYLQYQTDKAIAEANRDLADVNLDDATIAAPANGVISRRFVNPGESVNMHQSVFEIVEMDRVLLVVGVPESRIRRLLDRQAEVRRARQQGVDDRFVAHVQLVGSDARGRSREPLEGQVYRISTTADDRSGLFEVEVLLDNREGMLRPGLIAVARLVTDRIPAYRMPASCAQFVENRTFIYSVANTPEDLHVLYWNLGPAPQYRAQRFELKPGNYVEQGSDLVIFDLPEEFRTVVVRGQHRLAPERLVSIVPDAGTPSDGEPAESTIRTVRAP